MGCSRLKDGPVPDETPRLFWEVVESKLDMGQGGAGPKCLRAAVTGGWLVLIDGSVAFVPDPAPRKWAPQNKPSHKE